MTAGAFQSKTWVPINEASVQFDIPAFSFYAWFRLGCPWLAGKKPRRRKVEVPASPPSIRPRKVLTIHSGDLKAIAAAREAGSLGVADEDAIGYAEIQTGFGISRATLLKWVSRGIPFLKQAKIRTRLVRVVMAD